MGVKVVDKLRWVICKWREGKRVEDGVGRGEDR